MVTSQNVRYGIGTLMPSTPRKQRIYDLINEYIDAGKKFTTQDMINIQLDAVDVNARLIMRSLEKILTEENMEYLYKQFESEEDKQILKKFIDHLRGWDANYHVNSSQACLFATWEKEYHVSLLADQLPSVTLRETLTNQQDSDIFLIDVLQHLETDISYLSKYCATTTKIFGQEYNATENKCLVSLAFNAVRAWKILEKGISKDPKQWRWGAMHKHVYEHIPFSMIPGFKQIFHREVEASGSRRTISFGLYNFHHNDLEKRAQLNCEFSANFRFAIDMASYDEPEKYDTFMSIDTGISGNIFSKHYFDMNELHHSTSIKMEFDREKIEKSAKYKLELIQK